MGDWIYLIGGAVGAGLICVVPALLIARKWPGWGTPRIALTATAIPMLLILGLVILGIWSVGPPRPDEIDAGGMAIAAYMFLGMCVEMLILLIGLPCALIAAHEARKSRR
jgi:hypothetical protein